MGFIAPRVKACSATCAVSRLCQSDQMTITSEEVLKRWTSLGKSLRLSRSSAFSLQVSFNNSFRSLIAKYKILREIEFRELGAVVRQSNELLKPLGEPLQRNLALNRWLLGAREEAYSDWLAWLFTQMTNEELASVLSLPKLRDLKFGTSQPRAEREIRVDHGHESRSGRLDILLHLQDLAIIVLEVKLGSDIVADTKKQVGYIKSIELDPTFCKLSRNYIILLTKSEKDVIDGFEVREYAILCRNLRRLATAWISQEKLFAATAMIMIVASIEHNLLHMSLHRDFFSEDTLSHLSRFSDESTYE